MTSNINQDLFKGMALTSQGRLSECLIRTNCVLTEWEFEDCTKNFNELVNICIKLPRTNVVKQTNNYWHGVCRSLIFRFPDDLEILNLSKEGIIQVRSASRIGASDLGVNQNRINTIKRELMKNS